jgi:hypothetical protein
VRAVIAEGVREIWLTSEDTGAYGRDIGTDLPSLLRAIVAELPDGVMLRLGMTNPPYIMEHVEAVAEILNVRSTFRMHALWLTIFGLAACTRVRLPAHPRAIRIRCRPSRDASRVHCGRLSFCRGHDSPTSSGSIDPHR